MQEQPTTPKPKIPELRPVESSQIAAIGYDETTQTLGVQFKSGGIYTYSNFTPADWTAFSNAKSVGSHFYQFIKPYANKFPYIKQS